MEGKEIEKKLNDKLICLLTITIEFLLYSVLNQKMFITVQTKITQEELIVSSRLRDNIHKKKVKFEIPEAPIKKMKKKYDKIKKDNSIKPMFSPYETLMPKNSCFSTTESKEYIGNEYKLKKIKCVRSINIYKGLESYFSLH